MSEIAKLKVKALGDEELIRVIAKAYQLSNVNNDQLGEEILQQRERIGSSIYESRYEDTFFRPGPGSEGMRFYQQLAGFFKTLGYRSRPGDDWWSQIHHKHESTDWHTHETNDHSTLSFVYYVRVRPGAGDIVFSVAPDSKISHFIGPVEGMLLLWPSWVWHKVTKNLGDDYRLVIAGNLDPVT